MECRPTTLGNATTNLSDAACYVGQVCWPPEGGHELKNDQLACWGVLESPQQQLFSKPAMLAASVKAPWCLPL